MKAVLALACLAIASVAAQAQDGIDPTRPPAVLTQPAAMAGTGTGTGAGMAPLAERGWPQLQSILVSQHPGGRRVAVIDGKLVRQGQRVGELRVLAIDAGSVRLQRGGQTQTLKLFRPAPRVATVQP
jgi:MSHA biogenesis protein MshK